MEPLMTMVSLKLKGMLRKERRGAAVLETVILIVVAVVIVGFILNFFVGKDAEGKTFLGKIFDKILGFLKLTPEINP
jgi:hypothetical protein